MFSFVPFGYHFSETARPTKPLPHLSHGNALRLVMRFAGHLPFFLLVSPLLLPQGLNLFAAAAISLSYAVFCSEIAGWLNARQSGAEQAYRISLTPLTGSLVLIAAMAVSAPVWTLALSPASFGAYAANPLALWPEFAVLIAPSCVLFTACQLYTRAHAPLSRRLGIADARATPPRPDEGR